MDAGVSCFFGALAAAALHAQNGDSVANSGAANGGCVVILQQWLDGGGCEPETRAGLLSRQGQ